MPKGRHSHASGIISGLLSSTLIVMGGADLYRQVDHYQVLNDRCCWLFDCNSHEWTKVITLSIIIITVYIFYRLIYHTLLVIDVVTHYQYSQ